MKKILSLCLVICILFSISAVSVATDAQTVLSYEFQGENKVTSGYAQGIITLKQESGSYDIYWADNKKALDGYSKIATLTMVNGHQSHTMAPRTAIPADASKVIAVTTGSQPLVKNAVAEFVIPEEKRYPHQSDENNYTFMSYSDVHIDNAGSSYKFDDANWANALKMAHNRGADFIVSSGDNINNNIDKENIYIAEWRKYQKILAESDYCNPVYEAIGNHELWQDINSGTEAFINATGLEGDNRTSSKAYYEKEIMGDHFIFMALEGGFYPDRVNEFSDVQLNWLEGLLKKYSGDGKNIFIVEHSPFYKYGAGDRVDGEPYYDIPLNVDYLSNLRFKNLLDTYKDVIFISGHTHISFVHQLNYSDNNGTSCQMLHNSSVGGARQIVNGSLDYNYNQDETEAYIVDVYDDSIIFNGANVFRNEYDPNCCYIVNTSEDRYVPVEETQSTTATTQATTAVLDVSDYYLRGTFNDWEKSNPFYSTSASTVYTTTIQLSAGTYKFKLTKGSSTWYGNNGTVADTTTATSRGGWVMTTDAGDCTLQATGGSYQFDFDTSTNKLKIFYITEASQETSETQSTTETTPTEPEILLGDIDENGKVTVNDATKIQLHLSYAVELTQMQKAVADVNFDEVVDINDVTLIQKKVARLISSFESNVIEIGEETPQSALETAKTNLEKYYRYSSFDSYQALKKEYKFTRKFVEQGIAFDAEDVTKELILLNNNLLSVVDENNVDSESDTYTVYFENSKNWSNVYAYCWGDSSNATWPGEKCTKTGTNSIYSYTVVTSKYQYIIFSNGSGTQTKDICLTDDGACYVLASTTSPCEVTIDNSKLN